MSLFELLVFQSTCHELRIRMVYERLGLVLCIVVTRRRHFCLCVCLFFVLSTTERRIESLNDISNLLDYFYFHKLCNNSCNSCTFEYENSFQLSVVSYICHWVSFIIYPSQYNRWYSLLFIKSCWDDQLNYDPGEEIIFALFNL